MPQFSTVRRVNHSARAMLELVADVERYPEFLPLCDELKVLRRMVQPNGTEVLTARMSIGYKLIRESFTSRVTIDREKLRILVEYVDGPFRHLENRWIFNETGEAVSTINFDIDYSFRSRTFEILAGAVFERLFRRMAEAFETRADQLSGATGLKAP